MRTLCYAGKPMEQNLTDVWLRKDPVRWVAGALAGCVGGAAMLLFSIILAKLAGMDGLYLVKLAASPWVGDAAMEYSPSPMVLIAGGVQLAILFSFLGATFAHFAATNALPALLGLGLSWGAFGWVFITNLFSQSYRPVVVAEVPRGFAFFAWMVFGIGLTSVAFFDRTLRKRAS